MKRKFIKFIALTIILALLVLLLPPISIVNAASLLNKSDTLSSLRISVVADHTIVFRTPTGATESTDIIIIDFGVTDTTWDTSSIAVGDIDLAHSAGSQTDCDAPTWTNEEALLATADATNWGVAFDTTNDLITFTAPTDGVGVAEIATDACVQIQVGTNASGGSGQIINATTAQSYTINIAGAFGDEGDLVVTLLTDDQVAVSATVDETLSFSISDNTIGFGTLSSSAARYATGTDGSASEAEAHTLTAGTNAASGYVITVNGNTLTFDGNTVDAIGATNTASNPGTEQFGLRIDIISGDGTATAPYVAAGFALDTATFPDEVGSYTAGPSGDTIYSVRYLANIATDTSAGSYTSTLTYTATATF